MVYYGIYILLRKYEVSFNIAKQTWTELTELHIQLQKKTEHKRHNILLYRKTRKFELKLITKLHRLPQGSALGPVLFINYVISKKR